MESLLPLALIAVVVLVANGRSRTSPTVTGGMDGTEQSEINFAAKSGSTGSATVGPRREASRTEDTFMKTPGSDPNQTVLNTGLPLNVKAESINLPISKPGGPGPRFGRLGY